MQKTSKHRENEHKAEDWPQRSSKQCVIFLFRAETFGVFITVYHKVLNEGCESGDTHRYAVVVQDRFNLIRAQQNLHMIRKNRILKFLGTVASTESCVYGQLDGIWESM